MQAILMHKNIEIAVIEYEHGRITALKEIINAKHMPVGTYAPTMTKGVCLVYLQAWQKYRTIPSTRTNLSAVLNESGQDILQLGALAHGMGLTDQYWIKESNEDLTWEQVNYYKNGFSPSLLTLTGTGIVEKSPDYETNGALPKSWILLDQIPTLLKDHPPWLITSSANEVIASQIAEVCGISHATYFPLEVHGKVFCASPCFVMGDTEEFIPLQMYKRVHRIPSLQAALNMGLNEDFLKNMTAFDLLMGNIDRHEGNFGIIVNPDTMQYIRPAPLYDSGYSLCAWKKSRSGFKPFFRTKADAFGYLTDIPFEIPEKDMLCSIVHDVYRIFHLEKYIEIVTNELCDNANTLRRMR